MILRLVSVAIGGAVGASARFLVSMGVHRLIGTRFPSGTLTVNVAGSFLLGLLTVWMMETSVPHELRLLLLTGVLGAFTTFSTFSYESISLARDGLYLTFFGYVVGSVFFCLIAAGAGLFLGSQSFA